MSPNDTPSPDRELSSDEATLPLQKDLVAYLDGELADDRSREIEATMVEQPAVRSEVDGLQRSFDLLDLLDLPKASPDFSEKTMSQVVVETPTVRRRPDGDRVWSLLNAAAWVVGLAVVGLVGFRTTNVWVPRESDLLVRDLPVVENLDLYTELGSVEFVEMLRDRDLLPDSDSEDDDASAE